MSDAIGFFFVLAVPFVLLIGGGWFLEKLADGMDESRKRRFAEKKAYEHAYKARENADRNGATFSHEDYLKAYYAMLRQWGYEWRDDGIRPVIYKDLMP